MGSVKERVRLGKIIIPQKPNVIKCELPDGSFRALIYDKATTTATVEFSEDKFYDYSAGCYRACYRATPKIDERKLLLTVLVFRKSMHKFVVIVSTDKKTDYNVANTYDEVNEFLSPYFTEKKKKKNL